MRCVDVPHTMTAELEDLSVGQRCGWTVGEVVERHHAAQRPVSDLGVGDVGEHRAEPGVEQQWLFVVDEVRVEREPGRSDVGG
jgi:hypothetical protein